MKVQIATIMTLLLAEPSFGEEVTQLDLQAGYCLGVLAHDLEDSKNDPPPMPPSPPGARAIPDFTKLYKDDTRRDYNRTYQYLVIRGLKSDFYRRRAFNTAYKNGYSDISLCEKEEELSIQYSCSSECQEQYKSELDRSGNKASSDIFFNCAKKCPEQVRLEKLCQKPRSCQDFTQKLPM